LFKLNFWVKKKENIMGTKGKGMKNSLTAIDPLPSAGRLP
tara:strand:- start:454 stop:573 length:120 start_codon:yes stop_codon:yes gene_type:complete